MRSTNDYLLGQRLRNQALAGSELASSAGVVNWLGAVQAQDYAGAKWALGLRAPGLTDASVERDFEAGAILRTHVLRPTWHFVAPADIRWMLALSAPRIRAAMTFYDRQLEIDDRLCARGQAVMTRALRDHSYLTRSEIAAVLARARIPARGQRLGHLLARAELDQVICSGPRRGTQFTYALLDERVPAAKATDREESLAMLTRRYFASHGPATLHDYAWWSGLAMRDARLGIELVARALVRVEVSGVAYFAAENARHGRERLSPALLLPRFDEYAVAYRNRRALIDHSVADATTDAELLAQSLVIRGKFGGTWTRSIYGNAVRVEVTPRVPLTGADRRAIAVAAERYGSFVGLPVSLAMS